MNATPLFLADGRPAKIFFCGICRNVHRTEAQADECCAPYKCIYCGTEIARETHRTACPACIAAKDREKEAARFAAAEKVETWDGWIYSEGHGNNEGFFRDLDELREWIEDECDDGAPEMPEYVWTCDAINFAFVHLDQFTEYIESNSEAYDDFDVDDLQGLDDLQKALDAFNEANKSVVSYRPNRKRALLLQ